MPISVELSDNKVGCVQTQEYFTAQRWFLERIIASRAHTVVARNRKILSYKLATRKKQEEGQPKGEEA